ncbi:Pvc16 family protein [Pseudomonas sp. NPDC086251]|uniref:Pvc16 family protein n=1 Tax=Pseudomonas sp. NPDC086251 TaxID=3364431 RepID=UPI0038387585
MPAPIESNMIVIEINKALQTALTNYLYPDVAVRFDLPDPENLPPSPVISVFLYDIYEDLELKMAESRAYIGGVLQPAKVNVCCNYLITYWDSSQAVSNDSPSGAPDNQTMLVMNQVLNALINNRQLPSIPGAYTRVIPPKDESLFSLGSFWQSLGNKPRLLLNYAVTVPVALTNKNELIAPVQETGAVVQQI